MISQVVSQNALAIAYAHRGEELGQPLTEPGWEAQTVSVQDQMCVLMGRYSEFASPQIGHHDVMAEQISLSIKEPQCRLDHCRHFGPTQPTFAHAAVQPTVKLFREPLVIIGFLLH